MARNVTVDKLKGYACFLVLFGHVIAGIRDAGIPIPIFFHGLEKFIWSFHVALFLFLSGVVYRETGEWRGKKTKGKFILHKFWNLAIPYFVFSAVYIGINSFVGGVNTAFSLRDVLFLWKTPVAQYWFLYALFFLFVLWTLLSGYLKNWLITAAVVLIAYIVPLFGIGFGSFDIVFYSALAFGLGTCLEFSRLTRFSVTAKIVADFAHIAAGVVLVVWGDIEAPFYKEGMILLGIFSSIQLLSLLQDVKVLSHFLLFVNRYSFPIYLLHTIFTAGIRIVFLRLGITPWWIHVIVGTVCGLVFSVLAAKICEKWKIFNFFFYPTKTYGLWKEKRNAESR